jgi:WG containing repeat
MSIRPRLSSMLFWSLILSTAAIRALSQQPAATGSPLVIIVDDKYGVIDRTGKVIVPPQFRLILDFVGGMARVELGDHWTYISEAGVLMNRTFDEPERVMEKADFYNFSEGLAVTRVGGAEHVHPEGFSELVGGKYGFIDKTGKVVIPVTFDHAARFSGGLAAVMKGTKWGFIDKTGQFAIPAIYDRAENVVDGVAFVYLHDKWGLIDAKGKTILPPTFDQIRDFHDGLAQVRLAGKDGFIDVRGHTVIELKYDDDQVGSFSNGRAWVGVGTDYHSLKFGYIDTTGAMVIPAKFDAAADFSDGLAAVEINRQWGYIDPTGANVITPRFGEADQFSEGLAAVTEGLVPVGMYTPAPYGYIDHTGKMVIVPQFDSRHSGFGLFKDGFAQVFQQTSRVEFGYIDRTGKFIWPFRSAGKTPSWVPVK